MNKSTVLKIIIIFIISLIIFVGIILYILNSHKDEKKDENNEINNEQEESVIIEQQTNLTEIKEESQFYNALHYVNLYFNFIIDENNQAIMNVVYDKTTNVKNEINELGDSKFYAEKGYYKDLDNNHSVYIFEGVLEKNEDYSNFVCALLIDYENSTYAIIRKNTVEEIDKMNLKYNIDKNDNNQYDYYNVEDDEIIKSIFENFKLKVNQNLLEEGFNLLDNEYKSAKFNSVNEYINFINERKENIKNSIVINYKVITIDEKEKYIMSDQYNNYYIFYVTGPMKYTMMLDNYTVIDDETVNEYNKLDNYSKAHTCVDIFVNMINGKDYEKAYSKTEFNSLNEFEKYVKNNFYENNIIEVESVEEDDNMYIVNSKIYSDSNSDAQTSNKIFKIQLKETNGIDFVIMFN